MYHYANKQEVKNLNEWCYKILNEVQNEVRNYFTFDFRLIGSGEKGIVTQNGDDTFDLDYNIILQKDKQNIINNPKQIKNIFIKAFNDVLSKYLKDYQHTCDSTSVITIVIIKDGTQKAKFDVAILAEFDDGYLYRLQNVRKTNDYIWNRIPSSKDLYAKIQAIKRDNLWDEFKERYLYLKNLHLKRQNSTKSFSIFLQAINDIITKYYE